MCFYKVILHFLSCSAIIRNIYLCEDTVSGKKMKPSHHAHKNLKVTTALVNDWLAGNCGPDRLMILKTDNFSNFTSISNTIYLTYSKFFSNCFLLRVKHQDFSNFCTFVR